MTPSATNCTIQDQKLNLKNALVPQRERNTSATQQIRARATVPEEVDNQFRVPADTTGERRSGAAAAKKMQLAAVKKQLIVMKAKLGANPSRGCIVRLRKT
jgi:hypothetical protein